MFVQTRAILKKVKNTRCMPELTYTVRGTKITPS